MISRVRVGFLLVLLPAAGVRGAAAEAYVAPAGSDDNPGTLEKPFATVQRAQRAAGPGDTVLIRGGTYKPTEAQIAQTQGIFARVTVLDRSGEPVKPITYLAYRDERPVFDLSAVKPAGRRVSVSGSTRRVAKPPACGDSLLSRRPQKAISARADASIPPPPSSGRAPQPSAEPPVRGVTEPKGRERGTGGRRPVRSAECGAEPLDVPAAVWYTAGVWPSVPLPGSPP
jgi:hypothetical protein